jgi:predicted amidohydrolase
MKIALATPPMPASINDGLYWLEELVKEAAAQQAAIICFPESFIPGYPTFEVEERSPEKLAAALDKACEIAAANKIAIILPMDWYAPEGLLNLAHVISSSGEVLGYQTKNQLDPSEDNIWIPGMQRSIFEVNGVSFGITICHEGFRYPESVRWAAQRDAQIVFHPHCTGSDTSGASPIAWGDKNSPYYEKAMMMRAMENTIFFASSNYAFKYPDSASSLIAPDGRCIAYQPYGEPGVIVEEIDLEEATGLLAKRLKNSLYL